jgi:hypothetical protein
MASGYSQLGILEKDRGGLGDKGIAWHVRALVIRLSLRAPQAFIDLRSLAAYRSELGPEQFASLLGRSTSEPRLVEAITSILAELDKEDGSTS